MTTSRLLVKMVGVSASHAAYGAAAGAIGAAVLKNHGHIGYIVSEATNVGAAGNAVIGAAVGLLDGLTELCGIEVESSNSFWSHMTAGVALSTLGGMLGHAMLKSSAEMTLEKTAAAVATGGGVLVGCTAALYLLAICCNVYAGKEAANEAAKTRVLHGALFNRTSLPTTISMPTQPPISAPRV